MPHAGSMQMRLESHSQFTGSRCAHACCTRTDAAPLGCIHCVRVFVPFLCSALLQTEANVGRASAGASAMDIDEGKKAPAAAAPAVAGELPEQVLSLLTSTATALSKTRKATIKEAATSVASAADLQSFKIQDRSHPLHATTNPGILCVDISKANQDLILTGGNDGKAIVFQRSTGKIAAHINGHKSAVVAAKWHPTKEDVLFTASADYTANVWRNDGAGKYNVLHNLTGAKDALVGLSVHASGELVATGSKDSTWALYDVTRGGPELKRMATGAPMSTVAFHPDGVILAAGSATDGAIRVYDLKACKLAAELKGAHSGGITAFAFSENGFHCASAEASGVVKLWDLRKLANFHTINSVSIDGDKAGALVSSLVFDDSASYLAAATGSRVVVYGTKSWEEVTNLADHKDRVTGVAFGSQARTIVSVAMDRNLKVWA